MLKFDDLFITLLEKAMQKPAKTCFLIEILCYIARATILVAEGSRL